ncbi:MULTISPECIES: sugar phosphate nucleotidyltransferase [unclassified Paenibacillus]|uniref:sugar phosphate nucleotidyltransferase n=1 Tax=unclassified Paenibacillus TaxID=185978 RepID=UPI0036A9D1B5
MRIVLLSGGSGKRLWPLSNEIRSKVFLKLLRSETGVMESMLQRMCRELDRAGLLSSSCIVTHESQVDITVSHVGEGIPVLGEPQKRGTFTAVALAASYFYSVLGVEPQETVVVLPADAYAAPSFFQLLRRFPDVLREGAAEIALIGSVPRFPSGEFGYIVPQAGSPGGSYYHVDRFVEKPDPDTAQKLIVQQALWNCGVFACSLSFLLNSLSERGIELVYDRLLESYDNLPRESFDREVLEHSRHTVVIPYSGSWSDLGSWDSLSAHLEQQVTGKGSVSPDAHQTYLVNELSLPVHVIGLNGAIVAAGPDGILVADKNRANEIKTALGNSYSVPRYEETRWGTSVILDEDPSKDGPVTVTRKLQIYPGKHTEYHFHHRISEVWTVAEGTGKYILDGNEYALSTGDIVQVPAGVGHAIQAMTSLTLIQIETGGQPGEVDCVRLSHGWSIIED